MKIIITGSSGTIGTALMKRLIKDGHNVFGTDRLLPYWIKSHPTKTIDLTLPVDVIHSELKFNCDLVIHLAANSNVKDSIENPKQYLQNVQMTFNLLEAMRKGTCRNIIFASSREVYGEPSNSDEPIKISYAHPERPINPYGASKTSCESLINAYVKSYGFNATVCRLSNVYGRYDNSNRVIPLFIRNVLDGKNLNIYGSPDKSLDFIHIDDVCDAFEMIVNGFDLLSRHTYNIMSGIGTPLIDLASEISQINKKLNPDSDVHISYLDARCAEVEQFVGDNGYFKYMTGGVWGPSITLREGLETVFEDMQKWNEQRKNIL